MYNSKCFADQLLLLLQAKLSADKSFGEADVNSCVSFLRYLERSIDSNRSSGKISAAIKLSTTLNVFKAFLKKNHLLTNDDLSFGDVTSKLLISFEKEMRLRYLSPNTTSFYLRILRSYYHKGISEGYYLPLTDPFIKVYTGVAPTRKRALDLNGLGELINIELPEKFEFARDIFLFSFYTRGMSFVDIAHLKLGNIVRDEIRYCRCKTGQLIKIALEPCIREIIDKYRSVSGTDHIFPILAKKGEALNYSSSLRNINNHLSKISKLLGFKESITSYAARQSWATVAKQGGIPISIISECMGHTSEKTTRIYLSALEQTTIDEANRLIIRSLNQRMKKLDTKH